jgi:hypothetical protein
MVHETEGQLAHHGSNFEKYLVEIGQLELGVIRSCLYIFARSDLTYFQWHLRVTDIGGKFGAMSSITPIRDLYRRYQPYFNCRKYRRDEAHAWKEKILDKWKQSVVC